MVSTIIYLLVDNKFSFFKVKLCFPYSLTYNKQLTHLVTVRTREMKIFKI